MRFTALLSILSFLSVSMASPLHDRHVLVARQSANGTSEISSTTSPSPTSSNVVTTTSEAQTTSSTTTTSTLPTSEPIISSTTTISSASAISTSSSTTTSLSASTSSSLTTTSFSPTGIPTISLSSTTSQNPPSVLSNTPTTSTSFITTFTSSARSSASSASASNEADNATTPPSSSSGLSKTAIIAIAVSASVVGVAALAWFLFRQWKLRPSKRFERRLNAIDFSPDHGNGNDDFFEKTLHRTASQSSAERQRKALVAEEFDGPASTNHVPGVPEHDFTAAGGYAQGPGSNGYGIYNNDPFAHSAAYDYPQQDGYDGNSGYPPQSYDQYGNPIPLTGGGHNAIAAGVNYDYPTQDQEVVHALSNSAGGGYADLRRGNSNGSSGHGHQHSYGSPNNSQDYGYDNNMSPQNDYQHKVTPNDFPDANQYLGRPTGGSEGPYAQSTNYRY